MIDGSMRKRIGRKLMKRIEVKRKDTKDKAKANKRERERVIKIRHSMHTNLQSGESGGAGQKLFNH